MSYFDGPRPRLFAHRGASGTHPENTLEAFAAGLEAGADRIETDVHATADGRVVVIHDADLERTTDACGAVGSHTLAELRRLDAGHRFIDDRGEASFRGAAVRIPTLDEALARFPTVAFNIEIKQADPPIERAVLDAIDGAGARDRVLLAAEENSVMERIRSAAPEIPSGTSAEEAYRFYELLQSGRSGDYRSAGAAFQVPAFLGDIEVVTAAFVEAAHGLGKEVHVWTVNDPSEAARLLELGVDALMSDIPARIRRVIDGHVQRGG